MSAALRKFFERAGPDVEDTADFARRMLLDRQDLTQRIALEAGCGWRLAAEIHRLREKGWPILTYKDAAGIAHYRLREGWYP